MHETANRRKALQTWCGRAFSEDEAKHFDLERLLGVNAALQVEHTYGAKGQTYADVTAIRRRPRAPHRSCRSSTSASRIARPKPAPATRPLVLVTPPAAPNRW